MTEDSEQIMVLYRPVGQQELDLIRASGNTAFPPRLAEQPIFYPVLNEEYAVQIARDWDARYNAPPIGYVTRFSVRAGYLERFEVYTVGAAAMHQEYWIAAGELGTFNANIMGQIEVIAEFRGSSGL